MQRRAVFQLLYGVKLKGEEDKVVLKILFMPRVYIEFRLVSMAKEAPNQPVDVVQGFVSISPFEPGVWQLLGNRLMEGDK